MGHDFTVIMYPCRASGPENGNGTGMEHPGQIRCDNTVFWEEGGGIDSVNSTNTEPYRARTPSMYRRVRHHALKQV